MSERDQYVEKAKAKIDEWNAEIGKMMEKVDAAQADAKVRYQKQLDEARRQRDLAEARLKEMREAGESAWSDMKSNFDKAWDDMTKAFESAASRFR